MQAEVPETTDKISNSKPEGGRGRAFRLAGLAVLAVAVAFGVVNYLRGLDFEETDDAFLEGKVIPVNARVGGHAVKVYVADNQLVKAGDVLLEIDSRDQSLALQKAKGALEAARARAAAASKTLDYARVSSTSGLEEAKARLERARAALETLKVSMMTASARIDAAKAEEEAAKASLLQMQAEIKAQDAQIAQAKADYLRYESLFQKEMISAQQKEQAHTLYETAKARGLALQGSEAALKAGLEAARAGVVVAAQGVKQVEAQYFEAQKAVEEANARVHLAKGGPHQVAAQEAQVKALSADIETAATLVGQSELSLSFTKVYAPESGRVTKKAVEEGALVQPGQALMAVVPENLWVVANFKETQLERMKPGQKVVVTIDAFPDREFKAKVDSIQSGTGARFSLLPPENATGNYVKVVQRLPVKIVFDEALPAGLPLGPGMSVRPRVSLK